MAVFLIKLHFVLLTFVLSTAIDLREASSTTDRLMSTDITENGRHQHGHKRYLIGLGLSKWPPLLKLKDRMIPRTTFAALTALPNAEAENDSIAEESGQDQAVVVPRAIPFPSSKGSFLARYYDPSSWKPGYALLQ
ncbi:hypothetical protein RvY_04531 [Ramazzottius varieornatus]|uniref:Uncharacterized protein n=1 Tax=Ramazzottius varieornatus TaxID=947166 RepID=A0A1D1V154_RAMVA|nr:hypothetical protein RvY_04531 [Ramazzottius varieornatus]